MTDNDDLTHDDNNTQHTAIALWFWVARGYLCAWRAISRIERHAPWHDHGPWVEFLVDTDQEYEDQYEDQYEDDDEDEDDTD